jgi:hypothetical protein
MTKLEKGNQPPVTITGVAPWAMMKQQAPDAATPIDPFNLSSATSLPRNQPISIGVAPWKSSPLTSISSVVEGKDEDEELLMSVASASAVVVDGFSIIQSHMIKCYEDIFNDNSLNSSSADQKEWNLLQIADKPKILPNLKFHDLVFGDILGEGAFSTVKYARHITKVY